MIIYKQINSPIKKQLETNDYWNITDDERIKLHFSFSEI